MTKLINERTKEIVVFGDGIVDLAKIGCKNVAEMIEAGWKDYKEPEGIKSIEARYYKDENKVIIEYSSAEEASDAYEKARAWKRLKGKGFRFVEWQQHGITEDRVMDGAVYFEDAKNVNRSDLDLLFGGEE